MSGGLIALCVIAVLILLVLLSPAKIRVRYSGTFAAWGGLGFIMIKVWPLKIKKISPEEKAKAAEEYRAKAARRAAKKAAQKPSKPKPPPPKLTVEQIVDLIGAGKTILGKVVRAIKVNELRLHAVISCNNAATTAIAYGSAAAAISSIMPIIEPGVSRRNTDIFIEAGFDREGELTFDVTLGACLLVFLVAVIKILLAYLKVRKPHEKTPKKQEPEAAKAQ